MDKETRVITNEDIKKYIPLVNKWLRDSVVRNWNEAKLHADYNSLSEDVTLGNTGVSMADIKQHLMAELVIALQKYNPDYRTKEGKPVKEFTFVYQHLYNRIGQLMKKLTRRSSGYGKWTTSIDDLLNNHQNEG
jgi:hypothetical protein